MILGVFLIAQSLVLSVPSVISAAGKAEVRVEVRIYVPPHSLNHSLGLVVISETGKAHGSTWRLNGIEEKWLIRWIMTYTLPPGEFVTQATLYDGSRRILKRVTIRGVIK